MLARMRPLFFDLSFDPIVTNKTPGEGKDKLAASANNLYAGVTEEDLTGFTEKYGLNSRLVKRDGKLVEEVYKQGGRYSREIERVTAHLEAAAGFATEPMARALKALVRWYRTGETADRIAYDIAWVQDKDSPVDTINGFIEVYMDPRGIKGSWEALVFYVNREKTEDIRKVAEAAQWFEDRMPWDPKYRKSGVQGITANAIDVVIETGDSGPITPVGINLPNDQAIREKYGSKSVSLSNVSIRLRQVPGAGIPPASSPGATTRSSARRSGARFSDELHTNLHEVIGHASGRVSERMKGSPQEALKEQFSALEEARADLIALYFLPDTKLAELGILEAAGPAGDRPHPVRVIRQKRPDPAPPRAGGNADRRGPHAQPPDDRAVAHGEHESDRGPDARREDSTT